MFKQYGVKVEKRRIDVANIRNAGDLPSACGSMRASRRNDHKGRNRLIIKRSGFSFANGGKPIFC
ncbi:MAG: hypothetical protein ACLVJB_01250 [Christensenellales bacterium]